MPASHQSPTLKAAVENSELPPAAQAADSKTPTAAAGLLPRGHFWHLPLAELPPISPKALLFPLDFQLSFLLAKGFTRNKEGILHSNLAVSAGGLEALR